MEKEGVVQGKMDLRSVYVPSEDVVVREIEGELIIVPLGPGMGEEEDELFTLNETGREVWRRLDGRHTLKEVVQELSSEFKGSVRRMENDVMGFTKELLKRKMLAKIKNESKRKSVHPQ